MSTKCQGFLRALKKYFTLFRFHRFQKMITQIFLYFQHVSHPCNRLIIGVIRDFWTFSEISLNFSPPLKSLRKGHSIRILYLSPHWNSISNARYLNPQWLDQISEVEGCSSPFHSGIGGKNHFFNSFVMQPFHQLLSLDVVRPYPFQWGYRTVQDMISSIK